MAAISRLKRFSCAFAHEMQRVHARISLAHACRRAVSISSPQSLHSTGLGIFFPRFTRPRKSLTTSPIAARLKGGRGPSGPRHGGPSEKAVRCRATRRGHGALSQRRYEESAERIGTLVLLKIICRRDHARGPGIKGIIARERFGELSGAVDRQRFCGVGGVTLPNHTRAQNKNPASENRCGRM